MKGATECWLLLFYLAGCALCLGQVPANDHFTNALVLPAGSASFSGTLAGATSETGEPYDTGCWSCGSNSVWWSWTPTNSTGAILESIGHGRFGPYGTFDVFTGTDLAALQKVRSSCMDARTNRYLVFGATAGTTYHVRVSGEGDSFTFQLTPTNSPLILAQPQSRMIDADASAVFKVTAAGVLPLKYQWQFEGTNLPGQTGPILLLHHLRVDKAGGYSVIVSNLSGSATSAVANLAISPGAFQPRLVATNGPNPDKFYISITGKPWVAYNIEWTTNLINWEDEGLVLQTDEFTLFEVPRASSSKFWRAWRYVEQDVNAEICTAQLTQIEFAAQLWALENGYGGIHSMNESDLLPYMQQVPVCPSGGTGFSDSYTIRDISTRPVCQRVVGTHVPP